MNSKNNLKPSEKKYVTIKKLDSNGHAFDEMVEIPEQYRMMASDVSKSVREMVKLECKSSDTFYSI